MRQAALPFAVLCAAALSQTVLSVPSSYSTIQSAIVAAQDGDTVVVADGVYFESINFLGKAITVRSLRGPDATTIDAGLMARVVSFENNEGRGTVLEGFTLTNGLASGTAGYDSWGGGIRCWYASPTIRRCRIEANHAGTGWAPGGHSGGGIMTFAGAPWIDACVIACNTAGVSGGAAHFRELPSPILTNCLIYGNTAGVDTGGINTSALVQLQIVNCTIVGNTATFGGGVGADGGFPGGSTISVTNSIVWGNAPAQLAVNQAGQVFADHSVVQGGFAGVGNLSLDPLLSTGPVPWRLRPGSPCLDAGAPSLLLPPTDLEGEARIVGLGPDIGADEYPCLTTACARMTRPSLIGGVQHLAVEATTPFAPVFVLLDIAPGAVPLGPWGTSQIAMSPAVIPLAAPSPAFGPSLTFPYLNAAGAWSLSAAVPMDPLLVGVAFYIEGYVLDFLAPNGLFRQTNLLTMTFE